MSTVTVASGVLSSLWLVLVLPLAGTAVLLLGGRRTDRFGHLLATGIALATLALGSLYFSVLYSADEGARAVSLELYSWVPVGGFDVSVGLLYDQLSALFVLLITGVGSLVHIYSIGYLEHDPNRRRFFAYLNLFLAAMLLLVLANDYLVLYVGWEGVGLASYLLIAFWSYKPTAATAAKKAFIANRVGDVGLSLAIMLMFATLGTVSFAGVFAGVGNLGSGTILAIALLLLLGGCGKSAQFPLQTWLPDAMEGPTPASALIHAATMVTAGVYLIARSNPIFNLSETAQLTVASVGVATILIGAIIGCAYDDIKKVLAYSTISQIGYMFLGVGLGPAGYALGIFHLLTHGFFKAGLFMGAGSVMHGMNDQVDMRRFGGLGRVMPVTAATFGLGYLAIIGVPPFAGFWSKDAIIEAAFNRGGFAGYVLGAAALLGAGLTAFYMSRLFFMTFLGPRRWTPDVHPHESPVSMTLPMILLAIGSVGAGVFFKYVFVLADWLAPVLGRAPEGEPAALSPVVLTVLTLVVVVAGVVGAYTQYLGKAVPQTAPSAVSPATRAARRNLYADTFNESLLMRPGQYLTRALVFFDGRGVDGAVNGLAAAVGGSSARIRRLQTGFVRSYSLTMLGGAVVVLAALLLVRTG